MYFTESYGKQPAFKGVAILTMPPVLMIQLKRFEFSPITEKNQKILQKFRYPQQIDFSKWTIHKQIPQLYSLYAVLVHQGSKAQSGHYYVFLNIDDTWYKFNDQKVVDASHQMVFDYNFGGQIKKTEFDQRQMKINHSINTLNSTAYMLVYIKKEDKNRLLNTQQIYPQWIQQRNINRIQEQNQKKQKKNYFSDIKMFYWSSNFKAHKSNYLGLFPKQQNQQNEVSIADRIEKTQNIAEWLKKNNIDQQLFVHSFHLDKQILICLQANKSHKTFNDLLKDSLNPSFIFFPVKPICNQFLIVTKIYQISQNQQNSFIFDQCFCFFKQSTYQLLAKKLKQLYDEEGWIVTFYIEDAKIGVNELKPSNQMLKLNSPSRNCLIVIIVQKMNNQAKKGSRLVEWYQKEWNKVEINVQSIDQQYQFSLNVDRSQNISKLREAIYEKVSQNQKYTSAEHIVIKAKTKKNSKLYIEIKADELIKDLLKYDNIIKFGPSLIKVEERITQIQCQFYYRFRNGIASQQIVTIIDRSSTSQEIFKLIVNNEQIQNYLKSENLSNPRILIMNKQLCMINDVVDQKGLILAKIQILNYISKEKSYYMIVEGSSEQETQKQGKFILLLHNSAKTGEKFGTPKYLIFNRDIKLATLRNQILQFISDQFYFWEQKKVQCNPFRVKINIYTKDLSRAIQLQQSSQSLSQSGEKNGEQKLQIKTKNGKAKDKSQRTIASEFQKSRIVRVQITHLYIAKSIQRLRIDV